MSTRVKRVVRDNSYFWVITAIIWAVFYQNLPNILAGGVGVPDTGPKLGTVSAPDSFDRLIKMGMLGMSGYLIAIRWSVARGLLRNMNPGLVALFGLAGLSMLWSIDSTQTGLRFVSLAANMLACFAFGLASWHERRFQQVVVPPLLLILLASLLIGAVDPALVTEQGEGISLKGSWHGLMLTKNLFGMMASVGVILCTNACLIKGKRALWAMAGIVICALCLVFSRSNTSMFAACVGVASMVAMMRVPLIRQRFTPHVAISIAVLILLYELVIQDVIPGADVLLSPVTSLTGKDTTFSARTIIWKVIKEHIQLNPYLGSGYGAYWVGPISTSPSYIFISVMWWYPTESHNGYLEVVNDLGLLGLGCVLLFIWFYIRQALQLMHTDRPQAALFLAVLFQEMILNMSESDWISRSNTFMILTLGSVCMARALGDRRPQTADLQRQQPARYKSALRGNSRY
jgi:exopolysaccharide production protein ExoQ